MSETIKPQIFGTYTSPAKETVTPQIFAAYTPVDKKHITPFMFAAYAPVEPTEIEPASVTPASISVSRNETAEISLSSLQIAVSYYTPPSPNYPSYYLPQAIALSYFPPDKHLGFPLWPREDNLLFFPPELIKFKWDSIKKISWETKAIKSAGGRLRTAANQVRPRITIETKLNHITDEQTQILYDFIRKVEGGKTPFFWLDREENTVNDVLLPRDGFGHYRLPVKPFPFDYTELMYYADNLTFTLGGEVIPGERLLLRYGELIVLTDDGYEIRTDLPEARASFRYYWRVHFVDEGQGVERVFRNFNRSKTLKMEVMR